MDESVQKHLIIPGRTPIAQATRRIYTRDQQYTYDRATIDSTGAFLVGQLERLDPTLNEPLVEFTWSRDIDVREDVSAADEFASWTNSAFASAGGFTPAGINWISNEANAVAGASVDIARTAQPLRLWGQEVKYTVPELVKAQKLGMPVDVQKVEAMQQKFQMDVDQLVYYGDPVIGTTGLLNASVVTPTTAAAVGTGSATTFISKTPVQILADVNLLLTNTWAASGWKVYPNRLLLPPFQLGYLAATMVNTAANYSILNFIKQNNICTLNGVELEVFPVKWAIGLGAGGTQGVTGTVDRMVAYNKNRKYVQFPMTALQRTPLEYRSLWQITTYWGRIGQVENRYTAVTMGYMDGI